ncbi:MAG TPA: lysophospholipid acyltransferase family protein [Anaeromyxobacteraceae bacterium]|nr:lysophospholipid acyltransferase family protein [Anaeromyxobacteraceae bacterium]
MIAGARPVQGWRRALLGALGELAGELAWLVRVRRGVVLSNLRLAFPDLGEAERRRIGRASFKRLGRMAPEFLLAPRLSREELEGYFVYEGMDRLLAERASGRGVIVCTGHFGPFELLAAVHALLGFPITMITRRMGRSRLNDLWRGARARAGVKELVARRGATLWAARRALAEGRVLGYVIDQNQPLHRAIFPNFFGVKAATSATPAVLALRTGAKVFFAVALPREGGRHRLVVEGPLAPPSTGHRAADVLAFTQELNDRLERWVRAYPEQWYWLHRRFKTRPPGEGAPSGGPPPNAHVDRGGAKR